MTIVYSYFISSVLLFGVLDLNTVGANDVLRVKAADKGCVGGKYLAVEERLPSTTRLGKMEWVGGFVIECRALKERYSEVPAELFEVDK